MAEANWSRSLCRSTQDSGPSSAVDRLAGAARARVGDGDRGRVRGAAAQRAVTDAALERGAVAGRSPVAVDRAGRRAAIEDGVRARDRAVAADRARVIGALDRRAGTGGGAVAVDE